MGKRAPGRVQGLLRRHRQPGGGLLRELPEVLERGRSEFPGSRGRPIHEWNRDGHLAQPAIRIDRIADADGVR